MLSGIAIATVGCMEWKYAHGSRLAFTVAVALSVWSVDGRGQAQSRTPRFKAGVDLVSVDVCVRNASGRFLPDLSAADFLVLENGIRQHIEFLAPPSAMPLTAVLS